jgi:hypothetical protein
MESDDVRVAKCGRSARFAEEALELLFGLGRRVVEDLRATVRLRFVCLARHTQLDVPKANAFSSSNPWILGNSLTALFEQKTPYLGRDPREPKFWVQCFPSFPDPMHCQRGPRMFRWWPELLYQAICVAMGEVEPREIFSPPPPP